MKREMTRLRVLQQSLLLGMLTIVLAAQPSPPSYAEGLSTQSGQTLIPELQLIKEEETVSIASGLRAADLAGAVECLCDYR